MKKYLFFAALCLASFTSKAQSTTLGISNNRPCDVYIVLYGDNGCGMSARTGVIAIPSNATPPGPVVNTSAFSWTPFTPTHFTAVRIYEGDPSSCSGITVATIGESCTGLPNSATIGTLDNTCMPCGGSGAVNWNPGALILHP